MKKQIYKFLIKIDVIMHTVFSFFITFFGGLHFCVIEDIYSKGNGWIDAILKAGFTWELLIAIIIFVVSLLYDNYITKKSIHNIENNKKEIINKLLSSLTKAIFSAYDNQIDVSSIVQVCDYRKKIRKVEYQYNTDENITKSQIMGIEFGDVGERCIKKGRELLKVLTYDEWENGDDKYKDIVPETLRLMVALPIFEGNTVIAVLEIDVFESTTESKHGYTKPDYITDDITVKKIEEILKQRANKKMLGDWASAISLLIQ